jgi:hypothetical protein
VLLYRNRVALERASWAEAVVAARTEQEALRLVQGHDVRRVAVVEGWAGGGSSSPALPGDRVGTAEWADGLLVLETRSQRGGFLRISEVWHPGWRAWIAGEEIPLYRTNGALMGAWIPAGAHRVRLEFQPLWWRESLGLSAVAWAGILGWTLVLMRQRRRRRESRGAA